MGQSMQVSTRGHARLEEVPVVRRPNARMGLHDVSRSFLLAHMLPRLQFLPERDVSAHQVLQGCAGGLVGVSLLKRGPGAQTTFGTLHSSAAPGVRHPASAWYVKKLASKTCVHGGCFRRLTTCKACRFLFASV